METSTQSFQTNNSNAITKPGLESANVARKAQALVSNSTTISLSNSTNSVSALLSTAQQSNVAGIAGGGCLANKSGGTSDHLSAATTLHPIAHKVNSIAKSTGVVASNSVSSVANLITQTQATVVSNGQVTPTQQIIQVSSQGGAIMPGQQLMVQTLPGRSIQLRHGQFQQIQLIPFGNLQGQNQRPVIIQQTPTITSMANLAHNNVAKITSVGNTAAHQKPVIIQQAAAGQFIHSANAQSHSLHGHNVTKIATVGRAPARRAQQGKMVLGHLTTANPTSTSIATSVGSTVTSNHTGVLAVAANQQNHHHLTNSNSTNPNSTNATLTANPQVTRLNIISSLPSGVHTSVSNVVQQHAAGKPPILSLNKSLIINPASSVVQPSLVGNVVNMSNFNASAHPQLKQTNATNFIPAVMTLTTLTTSSGSLPGRHTMITSNSSLAPQQQAAQFNQVSSAAISASPLATSNNSGHLIINSSSNQPTNLTQQQQQQIASSTATISTTNQSQQHHQQSTTNQSQLNLAPPQQLTSSTIRSSNSLSSPIKQQLPQNTPSSPRPSILIRKRVGTPLDLDSKLNYQTSPSSINSNSANAKASHLNSSAKQNLLLKYQNSSSLASSSTTTTAAAATVCSNSVLTGGALKGAHETNSPSVAKQHQNANLINNTIKKPNSLEGSNQPGQLLIKSENNEQHLPNSSSSKQPDSTNQLANNTSSGNLSGNAANSLPNNSASTATPVDCRQITPRKRRKQLLEPFMLTTSQNIKLLNDDTGSAVNMLCNEDLMRKKDNGAGSSNYAASASSIVRRPRPSLLSSYNLTWKSLQFHFLRHAEVKIKNEKKVNLQDLTNESLKKRNAWKVNHLSAQLEDILDSEISFNRKLKELSKLYSENKNRLPPKVKELGNQPFNAKVCHNSISVLDKLNDLFAANIQRSNLFHDQIRDTNSLLNKLSNDHQEKVTKMTKKFLNTKRSGSVKV